MTAQPSAYARLRRALDRDNPTEALAAAAELPSVGLVEALELCLLLCSERSELFGRAALRWHGRYCREAGAGLEEAQAVLGLLAAMRGRNGKRAARSLAELFEHRDELRRAAEVLVRWSAER